MKLPHLICIVVSLFYWSSVHAVIVTDTSSASGWAPILFLGNSDPTGDQQTANPGNEADIVGDSVSAALYKYYDGTSFGFRLRLGAQDNKNQGYQSATMVGMDVNGDHILDYYIGVEINGVGSGSEKLDIGIYQFLGGAATTPNNTQAALANSANYIFGYEQSITNFDWSLVSDIDAGLSAYTVPDADAVGGVRTVDPYNVDGQLDNKGDPQPDYFLTFMVPFADLKLAIDSATEYGNQVTDFGASTVLGFVAITSQNLNQVNNDFNGIDDSALDVPYAGGPNGEEGGISRTYTPDSEEPMPVPEPASSVLILGVCALALVVNWRRRWN